MQKLIDIFQNLKNGNLDLDDSGTQELLEKYYVSCQKTYFYNQKYRNHPLFEIKDNKLKPIEFVELIKYSDGNFIFYVLWSEKQTFLFTTDYVAAKTAYDQTICKFKLIYAAKEENQYV